MVQERGGGLSQGLVLDAIDALGREVGTDQPLLQSIVATSETVSLVAVSPDFSDELDSYTYRGDDLSGPEPVNQGSIDMELPEFPAGVSIPEGVQDLLDQAGATSADGNPTGVFSPDDISLDRLDQMVDEAIETVALREGYATSVSIRIRVGARPEIRVDVTNERRSASVAFGPRGRLLEVS